MSKPLQYAQERTDAFLAEIDRLLQSEFPHRDSRKALTALQDVFEVEKALLGSFDPESSAAIIRQQCGLTLAKLYNYSPLLGFILRSTNVRNAFEIIGPFRRLTQQVLQSGEGASDASARLLLSSEWDYSPFTYPSIPDLPGYLFIGLPASESGNPLLVPLAGHELGHSIWLRNRLEDHYRPIAKVEIVKLIEANWSEYQGLFRPDGSLTPAALTTDLSALESWSLALNICLNHVEETLCDFVGLRLFGSSYFHAFAYLLSPGFAHRSVRYPAIRSRVANLVRCASAFGISVPQNYEEIFDKDEPRGLVRSDEFLLKIADLTLPALLPGIINHVDKIIEKAVLTAPSASEEDRILKRFSLGVPAEGCKTVVDIVNAAWRAHTNPDLLAKLPVDSARKPGVLKELVLKNFEIFEIERIQAEG